jgi:hypothetical protein
MAISGKPGLFKMLSQTKSGFIVESLTDGKRFPVFAHERVSSLEEISIFTTGEDDLPLKEVFKKIHTKLEGKKGPDTSSDSRMIRETFQEAVPEYDPEHVYVSDIKKAFTWYNILLEKEMLDFSVEDTEEEKEKGKEEKQEEPKEEKKPKEKKEKGPEPSNPEKTTKEQSSDDNK